LGGRARTECLGLGGSVYATPDGPLCRFTGATCPSGWSQYQQWSATSGVDNTTTPGCWHNPSTQTAYVGCATGSHAFSNTAAESCYYFWPPGGGCVGAGPNVATVVEIGCW
jgi:hypothetical protein